MNIIVFVLIVTAAAFCGGMAGSLVTYAARQDKRTQRRPTWKTKHR